MFSWGVMRKNVDILEQPKGFAELFYGFQVIIRDLGYISKPIEMEG